MSLSFRRRMSKLISTLEALPYTGLPNERNLKKEFYPFSNERGIAVPFEFLKTHPPVSVSKGIIRVAILIGQSSFCSLLAVLSKHCDLIVFADINPYLITHTRKLLNLLMLSTGRKDFEKEYEKEKAACLEDFKPSEVCPDLTMRKETLGSHHFLYSDENFEAAQKAALKVKFAFSHINLFHDVDRVQFFNCFVQSKITFFNATNLYEWDAPQVLARVNAAIDWKPTGVTKKIFDHLAIDKPIIMHSTRENSIESCSLTLQVSLSYEEYLEKNKVAIDKYLTEKFPGYKSQIRNSPIDKQPIITLQYDQQKAKAKVIPQPKTASVLSEVKVKLESKSKGPRQ